jgi:hypothetical protein
MRKLSIISLVLCAAGLATLWAGITHPASEQQFQDFIAGAVALGIGAATLAAMEGWFDMTPTMSPRAYYGSGAAVAALIWVFIKYYGMYEIGGGNDAHLVDIAWRTYHGQVPYADFPLPYPVFFILGAKFSFQWFGVYWSSFVTMTALFAVVTFAWSLVLLSGVTGRNWFSLLLAAAGQITANMSICFWWYNNIGTVACVLYVLSAELWLRRPNSFAAALSYCLSLVLVAGMKSNTAGPLIVLISAFLIIKSQRRMATAGLSVMAYGVFSFILKLNGISQVLMIKNYLSVAHRALTLSRFLRVIGWVEGTGFAVAACAIALPALYLLCRNWKKISPNLFIPAMAFVAGVYGYVTNCDWWVDLTLMLFGFALIVDKLRSVLWNRNMMEDKLRSLLWNRCVTWLCVVLSVAGIAQGICRERVKTCGLPLFFEYDGSKHVIKDGFFGGLYCGNIFAEILREESIVLQKSGTNTVWFGPIMEWGYAAFNLPSPPMQPVLFDPGELFAKSDEEMYFDRFMDSHFETLIFFKDFFMNYSQQQLSRIGMAYDVDDSFHTLTVAHLKQK